MTVKVIKAPAGLGKTRMVLDLIATTAYGKIEYYVPTHELADELAEALRELPLPPHFRVIRGRDRPHTAEDRMCKRHELAAQLSSKGYPVYPILCRKRDEHGGSEYCEYYDACPYIEQFGGSEQIYVYPHATLCLERGGLEEGVPGLAIIDESFFKSCTEQLSISLGDLLGPALGANTREVCKAIVDAVLAGKPLLRALRAGNLKGATRRALDENNHKLPFFSPYWLDKKQAKVVAGLETRTHVRDLLECLATELETPRDESHAVMFDPREQVVRLYRRRPITRFSDSKRTADIVILDASADPVLIEPWFPGADFVEITAPRNAVVTQCSSVRGSTTSLVPDRNENPTSRAASERRLEDLQHLINRKSAEGKHILVVGPSAVTGNPSKGMPALVRAPPGGELAHFNALRGIDRYKDFDGAIIVGRNQPRIGAVEAYARCIWYDSPEPLTFATDWVLEQRGYRVRGVALPQGVDVHVHPDPRVQAVLEQLRESETTQAVDRLRLIHTPARKEIILLSNIPVDIDVDILLSWTEITRGTRLERAWVTLNGVIPLESTWLAETFPDLWKTAAAAKQDVGRLDQKDGFSNYISVSNSILLTYEYRVAGQRRRSRAFSILPVHDTIRELTRLLGVPLIVREGIGQEQNIEFHVAIGAVSFAAMRAQGFASAA